MPRILFRTCVAFGLLAVVIGSGCEKDNPLGRIAISGKVKLDGKPLEQGTIEFAPRESKGGVTSGAVIAGGEYSIPTEQGLTPGEYLVKIYSKPSDADEPVAQPPGPDSAPPARELVPPKYNARTELNAKITEDGETEFDYDLKSR